MRWDIFLRKANWDCVILWLAKLGHPSSSLSFSRSFLPPFPFAPLVCPRSLASHSRPCGSFVLRAWGARIASFRRLFTLPLGRFLPALALRSLRGFVLRYRSALPPLRSFGAPLPPPTWLTPAFWLLTVWLLPENRVASRLRRSPLFDAKKVSRSASSSFFALF